MARLSTEPRVKYGDKQTHLGNPNNSAVNYIIRTKMPTFFILEAPTRFFAGNNRVMAEILTDYIRSGYSIIYNTFMDIVAISRTEVFGF